ncbi:MAG TPA: PSD1 and planctomycete cytochrome C domain-containing protein [Gemmataceae bacterium]|nr:PSD1 and planctomycete cytochrome C domain-containing protein [Gemmataceae bacterium]
MPTRSLCLALLAAGLLSTGARVRSSADDKKPDPAPKFTPEQVTFYEKEVLPVLKEHCFKCHGAEPKVKGGLDLTNRKAILEGGDSGEVYDAKNPDASLLLKAIHYKDEQYRMPPKGKLPDKEVAILTKWVKDGLPVSPDRLDASTAAKPTPKGGVVTEEAKRYWAYQPVKRPAVPEIRNPQSAIRNPIDAFILAKLEAKGLKPVGPAGKVALVRRAYYDLWGLPPTPEQIDEFVKDNSPDAWEKLIERLLASPHYGEKWGRHWLDVVRYAETNGYERDGPKPQAWKYRDYVIQSFNDDKPYNQFILEQLAGDEIPGYHPDAVIATGYYRLGVWDDEPADPLQALYDGYDDLVTVTGQAFLGMTLNCARCHDHKVDPIPQTDYYRMVAFFRDIRPFSDTRATVSSNNLTDISPPEKRGQYDAELKERQARIEDLKKRMTAIENEAIKKMPAEDQRAAEGVDRPQVLAKVPMFLDGPQKIDYLAMKKERTDLEKRPPPAGQEFALSVNNCDPRPPVVKVLSRGNPHAPGKEVVPGFPEVLGLPEPAIPAPAAGAKTSGRRTVLANWIASQDNPMTARVLVNRVWQGHFGRGIVPTPNDFGKLGEQPTHPELLDWLASEFVDGGWKLKRLHKLIMTSRVYQLSAAGDAENLKADPGNALFWRFNMRRLTAEEVRDSILSVSGSLNSKRGGPSIYPKIPKEVLAGQSRPGEGWPTSPPEEANRRSVYVHVKRSLQVPILVAHDQADTDNSCPVRYTTTVPTQALGLLNGEFSNESAATFAARLEKEAPRDLPAQVARGIRLTTGRVPAADEVARDVAFIRELKAKHTLDDHTALTRYCLLLLNTNEFVYLD